jgi:hypothetical protein
MAFSKNIETLNLDYITNNHKINFDISLGMAKDSAYSSEYNRKRFNDNYNIEVYESGEVNTDTYQKGYRVVANEGPISIKISNITIVNRNEDYDYALGFALDNNEPKYTSESETIPYNIERDGTLWTIPANEIKEYYFDQNPNAKYQWVVKEALEKGYKPTEEEKELGMEETTEKTGLFYLTFMVFRKEKTYVPNDEVITRGITRGGNTRGGNTRGISNTQEDSVSGRFGYGNEAKTSSKVSEYKYVENTEKYTFPIRTRIKTDSDKSDINSSQTIRGAELNTLKKQMMTVPF